MGVMHMPVNRDAELPTAPAGAPERAEHTSAFN